MDDVGSPESVEVRCSSWIASRSAKADPASGVPRGSRGSAPSSAALQLSTSRMNDFGESSRNRLGYIPFGCYRENQTI